MAKLFYKDKPIIGVDISSTGIKVMSVDAKRWLVLGYGSIDLDPTKMKESIEGDSPYLAESLRSLMKEKLIGTLGSNHTVIGIPTARTYSRTRGSSSQASIQPSMPSSPTVWSMASGRRASETTDSNTPSSRWATR